MMSLNVLATERSKAVGMQVVGRRFGDDTVLAVSAAFERSKPWHASYPPR
jgi:amidase